MHTINEDFVLQDKTGIIFLGYNQPLTVIEKIFAIFRSKEYFDKEVRIKGWYRRGLVPYIELYSIIVDGKEKKCHTYNFTKVFYWILMMISMLFIIMNIIANFYLK